MTTVALLTVFLGVLSAVLGLYEEKYKAAYNTALQNKCDLLKADYKAAFIGDRCFAVTAGTFRKPLDQWNTLHKECTHLSGYKSNMAHLWCQSQIDVLLNHDVIENGRRYFVGARQSPTDDELKIPCCNDKEAHKLNWKYFDSDGSSIGDLNPALWMKDQPDNMGDAPPETVVTLEKLNASLTLGFNDANPSLNDFAVLCEYVDFISCPDGWTLIGDDCFKVFKDPVSLSQARTTCQQATGLNNPKLAALHNDKQNQQLAVLAQQALGGFSMGSGDKSHNPVFFGMVYNGQAWKNENGDNVDYYRWHWKSGMGIPVAFAGKSDMVALLNTRVNGINGEARFGYWTVGSGSDSYPFICQGSPQF